VCIGNLAGLNGAQEKEHDNKQRERQGTRKGHLAMNTPRSCRSRSGRLRASSSREGEALTAPVTRWPPNAGGCLGWLWTRNTSLTRPRTNRAAYLALGPSTRILVHSQPSIRRRSRQRVTGAVKAFSSRGAAGAQPPTPAATRSGCVHREMPFPVFLVSLFACCHVLSPVRRLNRRGCRCTPPEFLPRFDAFSI